MADTNIRAVITADDRASGVIKGFSSQLQSLAQVAGGLFAGGQLLNFGKQFVDAFQESQAATAQLGAVLQSTGGIAGVTAAQAIELSKSLQQVTTFSDEAVLKSENLLLTFTNIGQNIFPEATKAVLDMSTALGQDTSNSAIQLGKALQDPILGVTALRRVGVAFNETQRQTIQTLVETGRGLEAQKMILKEVQTEFGNSAQALAQTFGGQLKILENNLNDVQESMGALIANALRPFVLGLNDFVQHNQDFIVALGVATLAAGGFAAAVIAIAGAVAIAMTVMGPFTILLIAVAALVGGVVFNAVQKFQEKMAATSQSFATGSKSIATNGANNFGAAGKAASDLAQKLGDIDSQMQKATRDFQEQMASMVQNHQQKVDDLKKQLDDETQTFNAAQVTQVRTHEQKVRDLENQIKALQITNSQADQQKINDLRVTLAQENEAYQVDTANAQKQHGIKLSDFQKKLDDELAFLKKHGDDIAAVQNVQLLDEIDKLKRSHQEQLVEFNKQRDRAISSAGQTTQGMANQFNGLPGLINGGLLSNTGADMGKAMADGFKDAFKSGLHQWWDNFQDGLKVIQSRAGAGIKNLGNLFTGAPFVVPQFAEGGVVPGALNEPTLAVVHGGEQVIPNRGNSPASTGSINITVQAGAYMGNPADARRYAKLIIDQMKDIAGIKNMTVADMLS